MTTDPYAGAVELLEHRRIDLTEGMQSIPVQEEQIEKQRKDLERAEQRLAWAKEQLLDVDRALALLKAGAR